MVGDVREQLRLLPDVSVQCAVSSPPYWGLRDYGHTSQIGLEPTPEAFVEALVSVCGEVHRVLKSDGVLWLNLGDTYCNSDKWGGGGANTGKHTLEHDGTPASWKAVRRRWHGIEGIKPKDLIGIPWMVAFALRSAGWYLRSDVVWSKPNPMPERVTDRPTKAHEYVFLLTKSERYYYDAGAIKNPTAESTLKEVEQGYDGTARKDFTGTGAQDASAVKSRIVARLRDKQRGHGRRHEGFNRRWDEMSKAEQMAVGSNARSVWTFTAANYPDAHFATFPEALPERCIKAGSRVGDLVLDPFCGSGTTGAVALRLGRSFVGIELNPAYAELARVRIGSAAPLFAQEAVS